MANPPNRRLCSSVAVHGVRLLCDLSFSLASKMSHDTRRKTRQNQPARLPPKIQSQVDKSVHRALESHMEHKQTYLTGQVAVDFTGSAVSVTNNMTRGDGFDQSTGIKIFPVSLRLRGNFVSSAGTYNILRLIVFQWNDAGTPIGSGILATTGVQNAPLSPYNWVNRERYKVLHDEFHTVYGNSSTTVGCKDVSISLSNCFRKMDLVTSGAGTTPVRGGIYIYVVSDDGLANYPAFNYMVELIYTDA